MTSPSFQMPNEHDLVEFFCSEPLERSIEDGYWCYEVAGLHGTSLRFSLNVYERSVQTVVQVGSISLATVSHEMATRLTLDGSDLRCEFLATDCCTTLTIHAAEGYRCVWSTLQTE